MRDGCLPWKQIERYTFAQLEPLQDQLVVPYAEPFPVQASLAPGTVWKPSSGSARFNQQSMVTADLDGDAYRFELPAQKQRGQLAISIGDAHETVEVEPKTRPELTSLVAQIKLPDYLRYPHDIRRDVRGGRVSVVKGSEARFLATATRDLASAIVNGNPQSVRDNVITTAAELIEDSVACEISWEDEYGLRGKTPLKLTVQANDDQPPTVTCNDLGRRQVVLCSEVIKFQVLADDDFGVKEVGIQWHGVQDPLRNPNPAGGETLILGGRPEQREVQAQATFSAQREGIEPQTLQVRLFAVDYLPDRERAYSPTYTLHVLTEEEHAIWLTNQLHRWSRQAQAVYERENQLHEANKELRELSPDQLALPTNRRRLETQAAAEKTNARRLTAVSAAGKQILREATKNDQFNVTTVENLAQMIRKLDELAKDRMPSVSELLREAAAALRESTNQPAPGDSTPGAPQPSVPQVGNNRDPQTGKARPSGEPQQDDAGDPVPTIVDVESSFNEASEDEKSQKEGEEDQESSRGQSRLGLPTTSVIGGGPPGKSEQEDQSGAQEKVDEAVAEQGHLLAEFQGDRG